VYGAEGFPAVRYRVENFRNINDSDWIPLERVTAFVGRNESGKTTLLKALHKFNPAMPEPYNPQREFPRDRYTREFKNGGGLIF
jgi:AAA15 family ATPase/GTPase